MLSIYIHVPFCVKKCLYCSFYSACVKADAVQAYVEALKNQIRASKTGDTVETVYFGGGTPTCLGSKYIAGIMDVIRESFTLTDDCEVTLEANPATVAEGEPEEYLRCGINRMSIGMQALDDKTLSMIGRAHNYYDFITLYTGARRAGFGNISVDIMYGLPNQHTSEVLNAIIHVTELKPNHISLYGLTLEPGTPMYERRDEYMFPDEDEELEMYLKSSALLEENGYEHYEISNYALEGFRSRHNSRYWTREPYLGFGPHAHSFYGNKRFSCLYSTQEYIENCKPGKSVFETTDFGVQPPVFSGEAEEERIMLGLRTREGVTLEGESVAVAQNYVRSHLMEYCDGRFRLTDSGMYVSNSIITDLLI